MVGPQRARRSAPAGGRRSPREALHRSALRLFGRLPHALRGLIARSITGAYFVGTLGYLVDHDRVVLVRPVYRGGWGAPGGLVGRAEAPADAVVRELREELGLDVVIVGPPQTVLEPVLRGVNVCFRCALATPDEALQPQRAELEAARWFPLDALPPDLHDETRRGLEVLGLVPPDGPTA